MSESSVEGEEKEPEGRKGEEEDNAEPAPSDDEDDCEGYFLETVGNGVNMAEKLAEANAKLLEEEEEVFESRPRKVQFSEKLVSFEPSCYSDDDCTESARTSVISEEGLDLKLNEEEKEEDEEEEEEIEEKESKKEHQNQEILLESSIVEKEDDDPRTEEEEEEEIAEKIETEVGTPPESIPEDLGEGTGKLLLVLLPKEQNSSCESIIGEEIVEEKNFQVEKKEPEKLTKAKIVRPKSAKKCCGMSKISPNLNYSPNLERKPWQGCRGSFIRSKSKPKIKGEKENKRVNEIKVDIKGRVKKINIDNLNLEGLRKGEELKRCCDRPKSSGGWRRKGLVEGRPSTAPIKRPCAVIKTELPQYNGLRSEYGLSAEQLQERKQKTSEIKHQRKEEKIQERQKELRRQNENEETFRKWLLSKSKKCLSKKPVTDTLTRSDVYIQTHASYAAKSSVPYSIDYTFNKKINFNKSFGSKKKSINVDKLFYKMSPHLKRSFNIYLGVRP